MARKKTVETETLEQLIPIFGENRIAENKHKKLAKEAGDKIKKLGVLSLQNASAEAGGYVITYTEKVSEGFSDDVLEYMHKHKEFEECIKTVEYVDMDALESMMYNGKLTKKLILGLDPYRTKKITPTLNVKEVE